MERHRRRGFPGTRTSGANQARGLVLQFFELSLHELQVEIERVKRVANFVRHARGQQGQRLNPFAFDRIECPLPRFRSVVQNERQPGTAARLAVERCGDGELRRRGVENVGDR